MTEAWAAVARASRDALALLGYVVGPRCLPDEAEPCGGSFALHACANLAALKAVADYQLMHLGPGMNPVQIYLEVRGELETECGRHG
ncbi:MAG TPA: hypothetical protein VK284_09600 [Streptosporangiaceae bacterium]|nr:hypothetical protein [Streptosporangiaceae bacterium]